MISAELMYEKVMHRMDMTKETKEEELQEIIRTVLEDESKKEFIPLSEKIRLSRELFNAFRRLDILQDLIEDDSITEIMVNGTENIFYEKEGKLYRTNRHFFSESRLCDVIQQIVGEANRYVNETSPIVDARLADGSRVNVVLKPVAVNGPIMTIRKFPSKAIKMNDLIKMGSLTKEAAEFIRKIVRSKYNIFVSGGTGAGKSTLLHMMGGLDTPTSGSVVVAGKELAKMNDEQLTIFRRRNIGFIFQNYNLVPILNVYENIVLPVELDGDTVDQKFMDEVVTMLGLEDKLKSMPNNLSGGQQQRVAIARALVAKPAIVLADEPTGNLDSKTSADVLGLLQRTSREFDQTLVMITHNNAIAQLADRIVRIEDGKIVG